MKEIMSSILFELQVNERESGVFIESFKGTVVDQCLRLAEYKDKS